jgi:hypothetical protein
MGEMTFLLPTGIDVASRRALEWACLAGGPESIPWPTMAVLESDRLILTRETGESGCLHAPWQVNGNPRCILSSCTLMERAAPYRLLVELARGKLNQIRNQSWEWRAAGLELPHDFAGGLNRAQQSFRTSVSAVSPEVADLAAGATLEALTQCGNGLVQAYVEQVFQLRRDRPDPPPFMLGCRYESRPSAAAKAALLGLDESATLTFSWKEIERVQGSFSWEKADELMAWAEAAPLRNLTGGPLVDMGFDGLPDWLLAGQHDVNYLARVMCRFALAVVRRYHPRIRRWILTRASNCSPSVHITEHAILWLNLRLAQTVRQIAPDVELVVAISRPWGDYLAVEDREHSPFVFADTMWRSEINLSALEIELVMGTPGRESYLRDLLDTSRMLDYYSLLGAPLRVSLGCPFPLLEAGQSATGSSVKAGEDRTTSAGQGSWISSYAALALCKPYMQDVSWICAQDKSGDPLAGYGLCDELGQPKPIALELGNLGKRLKE